MSKTIHLDLELPDDLARFTLPESVDVRLTELLDKQDSGQPLTERERLRPGLGEFGHTLSYLKLKARAVA